MQAAFIGSKDEIRVGAGIQARLNAFADLEIFFEDYTDQIIVFLEITFGFFGLWRFANQHHALEHTGINPRWYDGVNIDVISHYLHKVSGKDIILRHEI